MEGGRYIPCNSEESPCCIHCASLPDPCTRCRGECQKPEKTCNIGHSVYLAVFAPDLIKVGVSRTWRLETRLNEQGADIGFEIERFPDGELARKRERAIASKVTDKVSFQDKLGSISGKVDEDVIMGIRSEYNVIRTMSFSYFNENIKMRPIVIEPEMGMAISGKVSGIKGQALILKKMDTVYAINLDSIIGYDIEPGKGTINRQSSFFEFIRG